MASRRRLEGEPAPVYGPDDDKFSVEIHHGGFFCGSGKDQIYLDGKVDWFYHIKEKFGHFFTVDEISVMLGYGLDNVEVYWLLPEMVVPTGLRIVDSDADTQIMNQFAYKIKNFVMYFDIYNSFDKDIVLNPIGTLPKMLSPRKVPPERDDVGNNNNSDNDGSIDGYFLDSDYEVDDDSLFYDNVDDGVVDEGAAKGIVVSKGKKRNAPYGKEKMATVREWDELSSDEDELELPAEEEGHVGMNLKTFRPEDLQNPIFKIGMKFASVQLLRKAITEYSIKHRVEIKMPWNDKTRIKAHCDVGCPWYLYASFDSRMECFLIKSYDGDHHCQKKWVLKRCTAKWLANKYLDKFRADEKMSLTNFGRIVQLELNLTPSRMKLSRARRMAWNIIYGDEVQQFNLLWNYGHELKSSSLYVSFDACKRGFLSGCRPVICLDGCHIKTKFGGQLLTAVGIDPNDCIFPIAMAVVEKIKSQLMVRHYNKQKEVTEKWVGMAICPKIRKKLARHADFSNTCYPIPSGNGIFEVHGREWQYVENVGGPEVQPPKYEKRLGLPAIKKTKKPTRTATTTTTELEKQPSYEEVTNLVEVPVMSQVENPMLSQLLDEASQNMRHIPSTSPLPDSTYIISNLPPARHTPLTTATKTGRTSRTKIVKNNGAAPSKKIGKTKRGQSGQ
ncbi:unnamed protein product [Miscanthus lutarioriparius]|uniref:Transposase MuDR plant domain-containing protein n=1 Tax=Miscanthus lutarioriparius TaxID=422564 RepID=A0A811NGB6_9POAL|nr:unnamed protein product [Miscanthus lutarioriparius]